MINYDSLKKVYYLKTSLFILNFLFWLSLPLYRYYEETATGLQIITHNAEGIWLQVFLLIIFVSSIAFSLFKLGALAEFGAVLLTLICVYAGNVLNVDFAQGAYMILLFSLINSGLSIYQLYMFKNQKMVVTKVMEAGTLPQNFSYVTIYKDAICTTSLFFWKPFTPIMSMKELENVTYTGYTILDLSGQGKRVSLFFASKVLSDAFVKILKDASSIESAQFEINGAESCPNLLRPAVDVGKWKDSTTLIAVGLAMVCLQPIVDAFKPSLLMTLLSGGLDRFLYNYAMGGGNSLMGGAAASQYLFLQVVSWILLLGPVIYMVGLYKFKKVLPTPEEKRSIGRIITSLWLLFIGGIIAMIPLVGIIGSLLRLIGVVFALNGYGKWKVCHSLPLTTANAPNALYTSAVMMFIAYLLSFIPYLPAFLGFWAFIQATDGWIKVHNADLCHMQIRSAESKNDGAQQQSSAEIRSVQSQVELYSDKKLQLIIDEAEIYAKDVVEQATAEQKLRKEAESFSDDAQEKSTSELKEIVTDSEVFSDLWKCACRRELASRQI